MIPKGFKHSKEAKEKMRLKAQGRKHSYKPRPTTKGENHWNWKGDATKTLERIRKSCEYKLFKRSVLERDKHKCIWCGSTVNLQVDHIKPFALFPELRFAIDNGRTLCFSCHKTTDTWGGFSRKK